ncbi:restriction endonuclease subunit S [Methylomonas sp. CM2]|uniref:restriction endonuclease subunit S n=1 Tax=Methylomonas sp. CM2 TaxID=3417647 RepID=UPI003CE7E6FD
MSFPRYPEYKDSGIEWLGEVPEHWEVKRLRFVAQLNPSKSEAAKLDRETEVSFLPMEAVGDDGSLNLDRTRSIGDVETGYTYFREGDVTIAKITPCFENGKGAVMRGLLEGVGFGTTELIVARPLPSETTSDYLHWLFISTTFRKRGEASMYGAGGQKRVPDDFVRNFEIAFPAIQEQQTIAAFLDRETAKIDELIAEQQRLIELLKEKRQAVISHAVTKGLNPDAPMKDSGIAWLGEVPAHWEVRKLNSFSTKITNGYVGPTRDILVEDGVPYAQATHIKGGKILFDGAYFVTREWSEAHAKSILSLGDVLIVQTGAGTGDIGLVSENEIGFNCHALIIVSVDNTVMYGEFLAALLQSTYGRETLSSIQTGAMHPHLNCGEVKFIILPVPPIEEQTLIVHQISSCISQYDSLTEEAIKAIDLLKERRTTLISAAVTGKIDVRGFCA